MSKVDPKLLSLESKLQVLNQIVAKGGKENKQVAGNRNAAPVVGTHSLGLGKSSYSWVNEVAQTRIDCRRQVGLKDIETAKSKTTS